MTHRAPYRADVVGSLLRPSTVKKARLDYAAGTISATGLRQAEDEAIGPVVQRQAEAGFKVATDGELRRAWWHLDFWESLEGLDVVDAESGIAFQGVSTRPKTMRLTGPIAFPSDHPFLADFAALKDDAIAVGLEPKITIPSPTVLDFRLDNERIDHDAYADRDAMIDDLVQAYRDALASLYASGARYIQLDDTAWGYLCSDVELEKARARGIITDGIAERYAILINRVLEGRPSDLTVTTHVCRGNFRSTWISSGGYEPVAEQLLGGTDYDGYFLEYDSDRAGGFEPLRFLPQGDKRVVLGLITSKSGELEPREAVIARIDEAARYAPLDQLALSSQCGFASTEEGNLLTEDEQWRKLESVVSIADEVWPD
ncbi:5-methyltetrahydropteroyltriglutamate--homocysteine S-methyltransferase [Leifsonia shinshuensis]|uniref:5-methyltetrahydropteroyltriglutamate--homocysteine methyltransferase n=1 Tax=Leifsonia shinshuensis TaxID=150026 RepID=A0A853CWX4_9MICO|nr:5-methyltetrahydropteroyltriglutamate--homocysteine S-methyltransferase [Leifsonia shinshuensis]NYJ25606.1 5-methyltetrahydropteroyltriglutamate--homocysteine methyltransferase [Leifsonia shinshuensis]